MTSYLSRSEHFERVGSTNDVVRGWLADGEPEVCLATAEEQTAGRGRAGRTWTAPRGAALLLSLGFRPTWLPPDRVWQLAAIVSLAMADAAAEVAGLPDGLVRLKWPNDLVTERKDRGLRKVGGVLGETDGLGTDDPRVIVGIGVNADWSAADFPPELAATMTSLRDEAGRGSIDANRLLAAFTERLGPRLDALRAGRFDAADWAGRQVTNGRSIRLDGPRGAEVVHSIGVDGATGALVVADQEAPDGRRQVYVGEVQRVRLEPPAPVGV